MQTILGSICTLLLLSVGSLVFAQESSDAPPTATEEVIESLIRQLTSLDYERREEALVRLQRLGAAAEPQLREALKSPNPEIRRGAERAWSLVEFSQSLEKRLAILDNVVAFLDDGPAGDASLPGWERYYHILSSRPRQRRSDDRGFFVDMYLVHYRLLEAYEEDSPELAEQFDTCCQFYEQLGPVLQHNAQEVQVFLSPLLLVAGDERSQLSETSLLNFCRLLQRQNMRPNVMAIFGGISDPNPPATNIARNLLEAWIEQPSGQEMPELAYQKMQLLLRIHHPNPNQRPKKKNLMSMVEVALNRDQSIDRRREAILGIGGWSETGNRNVIEVLEILLAQEVATPTIPAEGGSLGDWVLASLVHLSGQRVANYGFKPADELDKYFNKRAPSPPIGPYFATDEDRQQAFDRWRGKSPKMPSGK